MHEVLSLVRSSVAVARFIERKRISDRLWQYRKKRNQREMEQNRGWGHEEERILCDLANGSRVEGLDKTSPLDQCQIWQCDTPHERGVHWSRAHTLMSSILQARPGLCLESVSDAKDGDREFLTRDIDTTHHVYESFALFFFRTKLPRHYLQQDNIHHSHSTIVSSPNHWM